MKEQSRKVSQPFFFSSMIRTWFLMGAIRFWWPHRGTTVTAANIVLSSSQAIFPCLFCSVKLNMMITFSNCVPLFCSVKQFSFNYSPNKCTRQMPNIRIDVPPKYPQNSNIPKMCQQKNFHNRTWNTTTHMHEINKFPNIRSIQNIQSNPYQYTKTQIIGNFDSNSGKHSWHI